MGGRGSSSGSGKGAAVVSFGGFDDEIAAAETDLLITPTNALTPRQQQKYDALKEEHDSIKSRVDAFDLKERSDAAREYTANRTDENKARLVAAEKKINAFEKEAASKRNALYTKMDKLNAPVVKARFAKRAKETNVENLKKAKQQVDEGLAQKYKNPFSSETKSSLDWAVGRAKEKGWFAVKKDGRIMDALGEVSYIVSGRDVYRRGLFSFDDGYSASTRAGTGYNLNKITAAEALSFKITAKVNPDLIYRMD